MIPYYDYLSWVSIRTSNIMRTVFLTALIGTAATAEAQLQTELEEIDPVHLCGMRLLREVGKTGPGAEKLPALYSRASIDKDNEFLSRMLAVIYVESGFNKYAKSAADAHGLMQMTEIAVKDAVNYCRLRPVAMDTLFDSYTNVKYGTCYLRKLLRETDGDWDRALIAYNGGYAQLRKYDKGETIAAETANYVLKVNRAVKLCLGSERK